jgi:hypothetical protein
MSTDRSTSRAIGIAVVLAAVHLASCGGSLIAPGGAGGMGGGAAGDAGSGLGGAINTYDAPTCFGPSPPAVAVAGQSCQYLIPPLPCDGADPAFISVQVDGTAIPRDLNRVSGWDYTDDTMTAIEIYGPTCDALQNGSAMTVVIVFRIILM